MKTTSQKPKPITATVIADGPIEITSSFEDGVNVIRIMRVPQDDAERSLFAHYDDLKKSVIDIVLANLRHSGLSGLNKYFASINSERKHVRDASEIEKE